MIMRAKTLKCAVTDKWQDRMVLVISDGSFHCIHYVLSFEHIGSQQQHYGCVAFIATQVPLVLFQLR